MGAFLARRGPARSFLSSRRFDQGIVEDAAVPDPRVNDEESCQRSLEARLQTNCFSSDDERHSDDSGSNDTDSDACDADTDQDIDETEVAPALATGDAAAASSGSPEMEEGHDNASAPAQSTSSPATRNVDADSSSDERGAARLADPVHDSAQPVQSSHQTLSSGTSGSGTPAARADAAESDDAKEVCTRLVSSWFGRHRPHEAMRKGSASERSSVIMQALRDEPWVQNVWKIGLVCMTRHPWIGVSADGLMQLHHLPNDHHHDTPVYAAVEIIKAKISSALAAEARNVRSAYGAYFECTVGSEVWFKAVPWAYRGQLVHQALVLSLDKVVLVMATVDGLIYSVVVDVPASCRDTYLTSLLRYRSLLEWAYDDSPVRISSIHVPTFRQGGVCFQFLEFLTRICIHCAL